jgi:hypothetical protein
VRGVEFPEVAEKILVDTCVVISTRPILRHLLAILHYVLKTDVLRKALGNLMEVLLACSCLAVTSEEPQTEVVEGLLVWLHNLKLGLEVSLLSVIKSADDLLVLVWSVKCVLRMVGAVVLCIFSVTALVYREDLLEVGVLPRSL